VAIIASFLSMEAIAPGGATVIIADVPLIALRPWGVLLFPANRLLDRAKPSSRSGA
jgi:hypothetical protein